MRFIRRRYRPHRNAVVIDASLIRSIVADNLNFSIPDVVQEYVHDKDDFYLNLIGEAIVEDPEIWEAITHLVIAYVITFQFSEILEQGGMLDD